MKEELRALWTRALAETAMDFPGRPRPFIISVAKARFKRRLRLLGLPGSP